MGAAELLASAVGLRWSRPDLTAAVAEHVAATWVADDRTWVAAAGWLVHGRAAVGDGRECASDTLAELMGRGPALLDDPAADRLRIEVAALAAQCEPAVARLLVEPLGHDRPAEVQADALAVLARCAFEDRPAAVGAATRRAAAAWAAVRGADAEIAVAALTLLAAASARRAGHPDAAVEHAAEGLARLDDLQPGTSAPHLAAALVAERMTGLIEAGRVDEARAGCEAAARHLVATARPTRQTALLRLTVARALAASASPGACEALEQAAMDAAGCDTPDLEGLCLSTLGTLREQAGRLDAALESMRRGVAAQRRDRARSERFRAALRALPLLAAGTLSGDTVMAPPAVRRRSNRQVADRSGVPHPLAGSSLSDPWTTGCWTYAVAQPDADQRRNRGATQPDAVDVIDIDGPVGPSDRSEPLPDGDGDAASDPLFGPLAETAPEPEPSAGAAAAAYDGDSWLATALADLDRVLTEPLPALSSTTDPDTSAADALDEMPPSPWVGWTDARPADQGAAGAREGGSGGAHRSHDGERGDGLVAAGEPALPKAARDDGAVIGPEVADGDTSATQRVDDVLAVPGAGPADPVVVGCVVVVDVVCAGAPVGAGVVLLRALMPQLADRIPPGARLRLDGESALSVVLAGQDRAIAAGWMYRTLPALFQAAAAVDDPVDLPAGTALRATVHDTDGPVGAQLVQRLDPARLGPGDAPSVPIRWGVPILPGSGGRRRRAEAGVTDRPDAVLDGGGRHRPGGDGRAASHGLDGTPPDAGELGDRPDVPSGPSGPSAAAADEATAPVRPAGSSNGEAAAPTSASEGRAVLLVPDLEAARVAGDIAELSVEGLGLAELLAGALAAYRAI